MEKEILSIADAAQLLSLPESEVEQLLAAGELPGRRIGAHWFISRQRLMQFIAGDEKPGTKPPQPTRSTQDANAPIPERVLSPNWCCKTCGEQHGPEVVECTLCGTVRNTPLMGYRLQRNSNVSGIPAVRKIN